MRYLASIAVLITLLLPVAEPQQIMLFDIRMLPTVETMIVAEAMLQGVPAHPLLALAWRESKFTPYAISEEDWTGNRYYGVFQLSKAWISKLHITDPLNTKQNTIAAVGIWSSYYNKGGEVYATCAFTRGPSRCK